MFFPPDVEPDPIGGDGPGLRLQQQLDPALRDHGGESSAVDGAGLVDGGVSHREHRRGTGQGRERAGGLHPGVPTADDHDPLARQPLGLGERVPDPGAVLPGHPEPTGAPPPTDSEQHSRRDPSPSGARAHGQSGVQGLDPHHLLSGSNHETSVGHRCFDLGDELLLAHGAAPDAGPTGEPEPSGGDDLVPRVAADGAAEGRLVPDLDREPAPYRLEARRDARGAGADHDQVDPAPRPEGAVRGEP